MCRQRWLLDKQNCSASVPSPRFWGPSSPSLHQRPRPWTSLGAWFPDRSFKTLDPPRLCVVFTQCTVRRTVDRCCRGAVECCRAEYSPLTDRSVSVSMSELLLANGRFSIWRSATVRCSCVGSRLPRPNGVIKVRAGLPPDKPNLQLFVDFSLGCRIFS